jgi:radical SAM protein with 4Fe4S-binding SPASM domain
METLCVGRRPAALIGDDSTVRQYFRATEDFLSGISIRFGTYCSIIDHELTFQIACLDGEARQPFHTTISASDLDDNEYYHFYFPTIAGSKGKHFALSIMSTDVKNGAAVAAWLTRGDGRIPGHTSFETKNKSDRKFGLEAKLITSNPASDTDFPQGLLYSPLSSCNMNCTHCVSRHSRRRAARVSEGIRAHLRKQAEAKKLRWIFTDYSGDIFHAEYKSPGELDFLFSLGIPIHVDTNGAYLNDAMIERIMTSPINALVISIDAASDETYRRIRIGGPHIDQIFHSAKALVDARAKHDRTKNLSIHLAFTLMYSNIHELPLFVIKASEAGVDGVCCRHLEIYHTEMESESLFFHKQYFNAMRSASVDLANSRGIYISIGGPLRESGPRGIEPCPIPWNSAVLLANGDIMACCVPGSKMGNVNEQSIEELWQSRNYQKVRARVNSIDPPNLCKNCQFRRSTMSSGSLNNYDSAASLRAGLSARPLLEEFSET